jgi:hypothetical protein
MKSSVVSILAIFVIILFGFSISSSSLMASRVYLTQNEREALSSKHVLFEIRNFKEDGSIEVEKMVTTYGKALNIFSHLNSSMKWNDTVIRSMTSTKEVDFNGIVFNRNCDIIEDTMGCVNLFIGTSAIASRLNLYLFAKYNFRGFKSYDLLGVSLSLGGVLIAINGSRPDDALIGFSILRIYVGFVGYMASASFFAGFTDDVNALLIPCPFKFEQVFLGHALLYLAIGVPLYPYQDFNN